MSVAEKLTAIAENAQKVFDAGKKAEYDRFWDEYQQNGIRDFYSNAFHGTWTDATYNPKYPIIGRGKNHLNNTYEYSYITDTKVDIDATQNGQLKLTFSNAYGLVRIKKLIVDETTEFAFAFRGSTKLEELNIEGVIGQNGFDVTSCTNLTHDSLMHIINCLATLTDKTLICTLGATNLAKLTDAEKAIATQKGWTLA